MEPNVVFVYEIKTQDYLTIADLTESGEWQTFELNHEDNFDTFYHEEYKPLEGQGYFINQENLHVMVEKINYYIQKNREFLSFPSNSDKTTAVHIISSESAAGSLRVGLEHPKIVIGLPDSLAIGPLWKLDEKVGQAFRNEWLYEHINYEYDDYEYENKLANTLREIEDIPEQAPIYVWYGNNIDEQIGLRFFLNLLRDKSNDVYIINSTEPFETPGEQIFHTGQIEPKDLGCLFEANRKKHPLSEQKRNQFHNEWVSFLQTKEVLRLWMNDEIIGVNENHYDPLILHTIELLHQQQETKDFVNAGVVIGEILSRSNELMNAYFLEYRIRDLIYSGILELKGIPKSMRHYSVKLR